MLPCRASPVPKQRLQHRRVSLAVRSRKESTVCAAAAVHTKTLKIGTRGSPLALAQAYLTRDLLKVGAVLLLLSFSEMDITEYALIGFA